MSGLLAVIHTYLYYFALLLYHTKLCLHAAAQNREISDSDFIVSRKKLRCLLMLKLVIHKFAFSFFLFTFVDSFKLLLNYSK